MAAIGMPRSSARREVLGMFQVETRMNFGEELPTGHSEGGLSTGDIYVPWSIATNSVVDCGTWLPGRVIYV
jgi:hypothetical protein